MHILQLLILFNYVYAKIAFSFCSWCGIGMSN